MDFIKYILYGFVSGFAELIPASGPAHQKLLQYLFGMDTRESLLDFLVHIAVFFAIVIGNYPAISRLRREKKIASRSTRGRKHPRDLKTTYDIRIVKTAAIPMILGMLLYNFRSEQTFNLVALAITSIITSAVGLTADYMRQGNKNSRHISALDTLGIGFGCALSAIPGISRVGMALSIATARGADRTNAYNWALLLSIPALVLMAAFDLIGMFIVGTGVTGFAVLISYIVAAMFAFVGGYTAITFMNYLSVHAGFSTIAYYNLGLGIFSFILYLIT